MIMNVVSRRSFNIFSILALLTVVLCADSVYSGGSKSPPPAGKDNIPAEWRALTIQSSDLISLKSKVNAAKDDSKLLPNTCLIIGMRAKKEWSDLISDWVDSKGFEVKLRRRVTEPTSDRLFHVKQFNNNTFSSIVDSSKNLNFIGGNYFIGDGVDKKGKPAINEVKWLIAIDIKTSAIKEFSQEVFVGLRRKSQLSSFKCGGE